MRQIRAMNDRYGSWLCENAPAEALTAGEVGALNHFREFEEFLV
jgi:hypothetical protein